MKGLKAEYLKTKKTATIWFTIGCALFVPTVIFLIYTFRYKHLLPQGDVNPWIEFVKTNFNMTASVFFPFYVVLSAALNLNIEHKSHSWKKIFLLPTSRTNLFLNKGLFLLIQTFFALLLFSVTTIAMGYLAGILHPELKLAQHSPNLPWIFLLSCRLLIASLAILAIHYVLSLFFNNIIIPVTFGVLCSITALVITTSWKYSIYFPYSFTSIFYHNTFGKIAVTVWAGLTISEWLSIAIASIVTIIGCWLFQRKQLR